MPIIGEAESAQRVSNEIYRLYTTFVQPVEQHNTYFQDQQWTHEEIVAKPQVLVLGQYSSGKTTFLRNLLGTDYPGQKIGPEPTSDKFSILLNSQEERVIPGQSLTMNADLPYRGLEKFGSYFLEHLEANKFPCPLLDKITIVDTPGVLSSQTQNDEREYDFPGVVEWLAERSDLIILFFDPEKLDVSEELRRVVSKLNGHESKLRIVLNKLDKVDELELVRVYGSLMWSLGRVLKSAEIVKVYLGSYGAPESPLHVHNNLLMSRDREVLMQDLGKLSRDGPVRKINRLVKRVRLLKVLCLVLAHMKEQMPLMLWKREKQQEMMDHLDDIYRNIQVRHDFSLGDFPDKAKFRAHLAEIDLSEVRKLKKGMLESLDVILTIEAPRLFDLLPGGTAQQFDDPVAMLHASLLPGVKVLKYGRSGAPKRRLLYCNPDVTELYWSDKLEDGPIFPPKRNRTIHLKNVLELRKGTEIDPENIPKMGTPTLRRKCRKEDMHLCFSLVLNKRSIDFQCASRTEMEMLFGNLAQHLIDIRGSVSGSVTSDDDCFSETSEAVSTAGSVEDSAESKEAKIANRSNSLYALEGGSGSVDDDDNDKVDESAVAVDVDENEPTGEEPQQGAEGESESKTAADDDNTASGEEAPAGDDAAPAGDDNAVGVAEEESAEPSSTQEE